MMIRLSLRGANVAEVVKAAVDCGWLPQRDPEVLRASAPGADWRERFAATTVDAMALWGQDDETADAVSHSRGELTVLSADMPRDAGLVFERLQALPFEVAVIASLHPEWRRLPEGPLGYRAPSLGGGLPAHGWLCAFRGAGHDRLVSRRWLAHGPWRLHRRDGDLSIVEFHELGADAMTALGQARPGHRRMGIGDEGGYLQPAYVYTKLPRAFRESATGLLKVVVHGRAVSQREMLDCCALRIETRAVEPGPVSDVAYVFMEEDSARQHLHELWLRGLQCRTIRDGKEVRLDTGYDPQPALPAWVQPAG
jgi:hypothetical protein